MRGAVLLVPIALLSLGPHISLWGLPEVPFPTDLGAVLVFVGVFVVGTVLHEVLHGVGHVAGEATWADVRFGMHWKALTPYARCEVPSRARSYRIAVALPGVVLGGGPLAVGLATGHWLTTFFGFLMWVAAAGDLLILWVLWGVPGDAWVQDHPEKVGCLVVAGPSASAPSAVSVDDLTEEQLGPEEGLSLRRVLLLMTIPLVCMAAGLLLAIALA